MTLNNKLWIAWGTCALVTIFIGILGAPKEAVYGSAFLSAAFGWGGFLTNS